MSVQQCVVPHLNHCVRARLCRPVVTVHQLQQTGNNSFVHVPQQLLGFRPHTLAVMFTLSPMQHLHRRLLSRCRANRLHTQRVSSSSSMASGAGKWAIAIHGGAGVIDDSDPAAMEAARQGLKRALAAGKAMRGGAQTLQAGGSALDAVEAAVVVLEEEPSFNAGRGTVFTASGKVEMEASVMSSEGLKCGACTLVRSVRNPVKLARAVMERTPHILLSGENAERLAESWGLTLEPQWYFETEARKKQWAEACGRLLPQPIEPGDSGRQDSETVGAVAIDCNGRLAAATSTGGRTGKWDGRIGDTPINGAGNYACPEAAVSGTGIGEQFMRHVVAYDVAARLRYQPGTTLQQAVQQVVGDVLQPGDGGVIAVDKDYNIAMEFNSKGMYRGAADYTGRFDVAILQD